jgi:hypothetical protein
MGSNSNSFCNGPFFNETLSWNTDNPNLTQCFRDTVLVGVPSALLWTLGPIWAAATKYRKSRENSGLGGRFLGKFTALFSIKATFICLLFMNTVVELVDRLDALHGRLHPSDWFQPVCLGSTLALSFTLLLLEKHWRAHASAPQFIFYFFLMLGALPTVKWQIELLMEPPGNKDWQLLLSTATYAPTVAIMFLLNCFADLEDQPGEMDPLENSCSCMSGLFFAWMGGLIRKGFKNPLTFDNLPRLPEYMRVTRNVEDFIKRMNAHFSDGRGGTRKAGLWPVLIREYGGWFLYTFFIALVHFSLTFVSPQILKLLIHHVASAEEAWKGYFYTGILFW